MRRLLAIAMIAATCVAGVVLAGGAAPTAKKRSIEIEFDNAFGLVQGGDFRVSNVKAGKTTKFGVVKRPGESPKAVVTAEFTQPGFADFRKDASCEIRPQSLIGEYYVNCQPGSAKEKIKSGGRLPVERTSSTIPADIVGNMMRRPVRERFRFIVNELGTGLAGRPDDLQQVLRRAHPGLRETSRVLKILGDQNQVIENFIRDSDTVVAELENNKQDVARFIEEAGDTAEITATRRRELQETFRRLPTFLSELRPTMRRLGELADEQVPLLADLERAAPDVDTFLTRLGPFAEATRPALRSLGQASLAGNQAVREGRQEVDELKALAKDVPGLAKPLRQFLQTIDDRRRAIEPDSRAKASAPPSPDKTAIPGTGGFTGMEAIWNYPFWQTLSVNGVDDISHMLRLGLTIIPDCSEFRNKPPENATDEATFRKCNQWLGPTQPGINASDPLAGTVAAKRLREQSGKAASKVGERRGPGEPEAGPLPGQRDLSQPQPTLPPALQNLLDTLPQNQQTERRRKELLDRLPSIGLGEGGTRKQTQQAPRDNTQLLDFLLGP